MTIEVPGRQGPTNNPLVVLNQHLGQITQVITAMRDMMAAEGVAHHHRAGVALKNDGTWGVFCIGCSALNQDFVYPCLIEGHTNEWPPPVLIAVPASPESDEV